MIDVSVIAMFKYDVKVGRLTDFMAKLKAAADPKFNSSSMPKVDPAFSQPARRVRIETHLPLLIEYDDMAAYQKQDSF
jgi:hypothetical protein